MTALRRRGSRPRARGRLGGDRRQRLRPGVRYYSASSSGSSPSTFAVFVVLDLLAAIAADARGHGGRSPSSGARSPPSPAWSAPSGCRARSSRRSTTSATEPPKLDRGPLPADAARARHAARDGHPGRARRRRSGWSCCSSPASSCSRAGPSSSRSSSSSGSRRCEAFRARTSSCAARGWTVFGIVVLTTLLSFVAVQALVAIFGFLPNFAAVWVGSLVAHCLVVPFVALAWTVDLLRAALARAARARGRRRPGSPHDGSARADGRARPRARGADRAAGLGRGRARDAADAARGGRARCASACRCAATASCGR